MSERGFDTDVPPFRYHRDADGVVHIVGEVDMASAAAFRPLILAGTTPIELDLSGVTFMDSAGIKVLVLARQTRGVRIVAASASVQRLFELLGMTDYWS